MNESPISANTPFAAMLNKHSSGNNALPYTDLPQPGTLFDLTTKSAVKDVSILKRYLFIYFVMAM